MKTEELIKKLNVPSGKIDVVLDTDTFNEIDDQFALAYLLASSDRLNVRAITAAPFLNENASTPAEGMEKSYLEILKILELAGYAHYGNRVFRGAGSYLPDELTPVVSDASGEIVRLAMEHTPEDPLYVAAIGAITNLASAVLTMPEICERVVFVWLGGHALHWDHTHEFNMFQDVAAARVIFGCGAPLVQLPCNGVVDAFRTSGPELNYWLSGKNRLADYLIENTAAAAESYAKGRPWTRVIWDVTAVAWLLNDDNRFMQSRLIPAPIPEYDNHYSYDSRRHLMRYVTSIDRDALFEDLFRKLSTFQ